MRVAIYARVSTDEQAKHGFSVDTQKELLTDYAQKHGYIIAGEYLDAGYSGGTIKRPALRRLMKDIKAHKIDLVLFAWLDRWFRSVAQYYKIQEVLEDNGVQWICTEEDYETVTSSGRFKVNIMLSVSQQYKDTQSEKIRAALEQKEKKGYVKSGSLPYGFKLIRDDGGARIAINEDARAGVLEILEAFRRSQSLKRTLYTFNRVTGRNTNVGRVKAFLINPLLHGERNGNMSICEAYISPQEHAELIANIKRNTYEKTTYSFIFARLCRCGSCGAPMSTAFNKYKKPSGEVVKYPYYSCSNLNIKENTHKKFTIFESSLEKQFLKIVQAELKNYIFKIECNNKKIASTDAAQAEAAIQEKIKRVNNIYINGVMSDEEYNATIAELKAQAAAVKSEKPRDTQKLEALAGSFSDIYKTLNNEEKRELVRSFVDYIIIHEDKSIDIVFL